MKIKQLLSRDLQKVKVQREKDSEHIIPVPPRGRGHKECTQTVKPSSKESPTK